MSNWSALLTIAREYRLEVTIIQICRHVSSDRRLPCPNPSTAYPCYQFESNSFTEPRFDEQYVDCGMNKLIWIFRLRVADYRFRVLLHSFAVHVPHPRWIIPVSMMNRTTMSSDVDMTRKKNGGFTEMDNYMRAFIVSLKKGRSWRHFSRCVMENDRIVFGRD